MRTTALALIVLALAVATILVAMAWYSADKDLRHSRASVVELQLRNAVLAKRAREWQKGYREGEKVGWSAVFKGFHEPWLPGHWYLVKVGKNGKGQLNLPSRYPVEPNSGKAWAVEKGKVYRYDVSSSGDVTPQTR